MHQSFEFYYLFSVLNLDFEIGKTILKRQRKLAEAKQRQQHLLTRRLKSLLPFPLPLLLLWDLVNFFWYYFTSPLPASLELMSISLGGEIFTLDLVEIEI